MAEDEIASLPQGKRGDRRSADQLFLVVFVLAHVIPTVCGRGRKSDAGVNRDAHDLGFRVSVA